MKRLRILLIIILSIILIVLFGKNAESFPGDGELWISPAWTGSSGAIYYNITENTPTHRDNVYCIEQGDALMKKSGSHPYCYCRRAKAEMYGDTITLKKYDKYGSTTKSVTRKRVKEDYVLAAILCYGSDLGLWKDTSAAYTSSQSALFEYWNTWVSASGYGYFPYGGGDGSGSSNYTNIAESRAYKVTIELFEPESGGYQNIIIVHRDGYDPREINIPVTKVWEDENNKYLNRPESINVDLYRDGEYYDSMELSGDITSSEWTGTFSGLDPDYTYTVEEPDVPEAYTMEKYGSANSGYEFTNWLRTTSLNVEKTWSDLDNCYDLRPTSVKLKLYRQRVDESEDPEYVKDVTLKKSASWKTTISDLPLYVSSYEMKYWVEEVVPEYYTSEMNYNTETNTYEILNTLDRIDIKVTKKWEDENNYYNNRPNSVRVYLYIDNVKQEDKYIDLTEETNWEGTFTGLEPVKGYSVKEEVPIGYTEKTTGSVKAGYTITNTLERTSVAVEKKWDDENNAFKLRPKTITVSLWQNVNGVESEFTNEKGEHVYKTLRGTNTSYPLKDTFTNLPKYIDGVEVYYTVREEEDKNPGLLDNYMLKEEPIPFDQETNSFIITNVLAYDGYKEIKGRVWVDGEAGKANDMDGKYDESKDTVLEGIKVTLRDENGNQFDPTSTTTTDANGEYTIKVNYDNSREVYKLYEDADVVETKLKKAYVEFEYDGMIYTTINNVGTESIVEEDSSKRGEIDGNYSEVTKDSPKLERVINNKNITTEIKPADENRKITARTKAMGDKEFKNATKIKEWEDEEITLYCSGSGKYIRTNTKGAWLEPVQGTCNNCQGKEHTRNTKIDVETIQNVNCALFVREQPDVAIFSDLTKVEVIMNGQQYTYLYGVRGAESNDVGLKAKFENKGTYTYRRPVNPADIAYVDSVDNNAMQVYVTYEVKVANLSTTLQVTVQNIINSYDKEYELETEGWSDPNPVISEFKQATSNELNITVEPQKESSAIELRYRVSIDAIKGLLQQKARLNNAVEIGCYSTQYGTNTLYAEQKTGGKVDSEGDALPYAGYDYDSHPENANIALKEGTDGTKRLYSTDESGNIIPIDELEDDTDIAPSFVLEKDAPKTLAGTVWEDTDPTEATENNERIGNGYIDGSENKIKNVKAELYNLDGTRANLYGYDESTQQVTIRDAVVETTETGEYSLEGVVTGEYFIRYTYGDNKEVQTTYFKKSETGEVEEKTENELKTTTQVNNLSVNARNYKSTTIEDAKIQEIMNTSYSNTSFDKRWPITHTDNYSVAVDNMLDRLSIQELKNSNYSTGENMTSYTKPFATNIEFIDNESSQVKTDDQNRKEENGEIIISGEIGTSDRLDTLDFGIIERPREALIVQKTITNFKLMLANGQILAEGNPTDVNANMNYTKLMGFNQNIRTVREAENALEKRLLVEIDAELMQSSQLDVTYELQVTNNNEIDYDYGDESNYSEIKGNIELGECDKYIVPRTNKYADYYYYGDSSSLNPIKAKIEVVDYINNDLVYENDSEKWNEVNASVLFENGYINDTVKDVIKDKYNAYRICNPDKTTEIILGRNETEIRTMNAKKVIANQDNNAYDNNAEIIKIDGKTARTIKGKYVDFNGEIKQILYIPGNYAPGLSESEVDDDKVDVMITPPTGETKNTTSYTITILISLITVVIAIIFIKKKILIK